MLLESNKKLVNAPRFKCVRPIINWMQIKTQVRKLSNAFVAQQKIQKKKNVPGNRNSNAYSYNVMLLRLNYHLGLRCGIETPSQSSESHSMISKLIPIFYMILCDCRTSRFFVLLFFCCCVCCFGLSFFISCVGCNLFSPTKSNTFGKKRRRSREREKMPNNLYTHIIMQCTSILAARSIEIVGTDYSFWLNELNCTNIDVLCCGSGECAKENDKTRVSEQELIEAERI